MDELLLLYEELRVDELLSYVEVAALLALVALLLSYEAPADEEGAGLR